LVGMSKHGEEGRDDDDRDQCEQLFEIGECVRRWVVTSRIGGGAFGETYTAVDSAPETRGQEVCIKAEKQDKRPILRTEVLALKRAQDCPNVVRYISSGKHNSVNFLVMEKLGDNLADVRRRCPRGIMDLYSAIQYTIACLNCIEQVHSAGLIHRDIKPSNFVLGPPGSTPYTVYIIDFGLAKRYVSSTGEIKPPRENAGFRGTSRYASISSHLQKDLGRVDDLWSLLFMSIEFITGTLPWRRVKEKDAIGALKQQHVSPQLVRYLPREMTDFINHLLKLDYADRPDYAVLRQLLYTTITRKALAPPAPASVENDEAGGQSARIRKSVLEHPGGDVILQLQTPSPTDRKVAVSPPPAALERPEVDEGHRVGVDPPPGSPVVIEMGSILRSGCATPAAALVGTHHQQQSQQSQQQQQPAVPSTMHHAPSHNDSHEDLGGPGHDRHPQADGAAESPDVPPVHNDFHSIGYAEPPAPAQDEFSSPKVQPGPLEPEASHKDATDPKKPRKKRGRSKNEGDPACGCCVVS
jgi:tau tubulin kinase